MSGFKDTINNFEDTINKDTYVSTCNCSFVTTIEEDYNKSSDVFKYAPATDYLYCIGEIIHNNLSFLGTTVEDNVLKEKMREFFKESIEKIVDNMITNSTKPYCVAGLQELNNFEHVFTLVNNVIDKKENEKEKKQKNELTFICDNVIDNFAGTKPTVGFIVKGIESFKKIENKSGAYVNLKSFSNEVDSEKNHFIRSDINYKNIIGQPYNQQTKIELPNYNGQYSKDPSNNIANENAKYMSIRDLGVVYINNNECLLKSEKSPDGGRPIGMIVKMTPKGDKVETVDYIHMNCHMPNPCSIKKFNLTTKGFEIEGEGKPIIVDSGYELWIEYCRYSLQKYISEMLSDDFKITPEKINENTKWILNGDLNDIEQALIQNLKDKPLEITLGEKKIDVHFNYSKKQSKTACPNSNSSFNAINIEGLDEKKQLKEVKENAHFNHKISEWKKYIKNETDADADAEEYKKKYNSFKKYILGNEKYGEKDEEINKGNSVLNKDRFAYFGDTILIGSTNETNVNNTKFFQTQVAFEGKSDHLFVESHNSAPSTDKNDTPPDSGALSTDKKAASSTNGGGAKGKKRKTEKYSKEEKKNRSNKMKRRNRRYSR